MRVQLTSGRANERQSWEPGTVLEVSEEEGARMVEAGAAVALDAEEAPAPENPELKIRQAKREKRG
jgi:hypothetical protein